MQSEPKETTRTFPNGDELTERHEVIAEIRDKYQPGNEL